MVCLALFYWKWPKALRARNEIIFSLLSGACLSLIHIQMCIRDSTKPARGTERLIAKVSIKKQTILISLDNELIYKWSVSTGRKGFETPPGYYNGQRKYVLWRSRTYDNAPMPFAVFFFEGYAVHGTTAISQLGKPASHGCVRVTTPHAKTFYDLVDEVGLSQTLVVIEE